MRVGAQVFAEPFEAKASLHVPALTRLVVELCRAGVVLRHAPAPFIPKCAEVRPAVFTLIDVFCSIV